MNYEHNFIPHSPIIWNGKQSRSLKKTLKRLKRRSGASIYSSGLKVAQMLTKLMELVLKQLSIEVKKVSVLSLCPFSLTQLASAVLFAPFFKVKCFLSQKTFTFDSLKSHRIRPNTMSHPHMLSTFMFCMQLISLHRGFFHHVYCN